MGKKESYSVKREITDAFMELMTQKSYMDITVTEIINAAGVARASFYRNFNSVSDVIDTVIDEMSTELVEEILPTINSKDESKWREFLFEFFYRFKRNCRKIGNINSQNFAVMFSRMDCKMQKLGSNLTTTPMRYNYAAFGKIALINSIAKKWMDNGMKETPEEMIDYIMSFITLF